MIKLLIVVCIIGIYIFTSRFLYKTYPQKIRETVIVQTIGYIILGKSILKNYNSYNLYKITETLSNVSFFCMIFFLLFFDYGYQKNKEGNLKEMSKKDIFFAMVRRTENTKIILTQNKRFLFFLLMTALLEAVKEILKII